MGPRVSEFEDSFASRLDSKYAVATTNCTVALHLAFELLGIGEGDEVICPSLSFVATCNSFMYTGAVPKFADIKSIEEPTIDPNEIEACLTSRTKAIIVMHYGGFPCDMDKIMSIANKHNLKVIEDACHAPLSEYKGRKIGTIGDIGCFSFFSNKNISTGEGGMLITNKQKYAEDAKLLRAHGMTTMSYERSKGHSTSYDVVRFGFNYRMDDIRASIGLAQLGKIDNDLKKRSLVRATYLRNLAGLDDIIIPFETNKSFVSNYIFPICLGDRIKIDRQTFREKLLSKGIQTSIHYPAIHRFSVYEKFAKSLPFTEYFSDRVVTLPMYGSLTEEQIDYITDAVIEILG